MTKSRKSEMVDLAIIAIEDEMERTGKHLIKTDTLFSMVSNHLNLADEDPDREELLIIGMRQVMESRLYARGYFSVSIGYFVNVQQCSNVRYLEMITDSKEEVIQKKQDQLDRIEVQLRQAQMKFIPDENNNLNLDEGMSEQEIRQALDEDAV